VTLTVKATEAANTIADHVHDQENNASNAVKIVTGAFNHCDLIKICRDSTNKWRVHHVETARLT